MKYLSIQGEQQEKKEDGEWNWIERSPQEDSVGTFSISDLETEGENKLLYRFEKFLGRNVKQALESAVSFDLYIAARIRCHDDDCA